MRQSEYEDVRQYECEAFDHPCHGRTGQGQSSWAADTRWSRTRKDHDLGGRPIIESGGIGSAVSEA